MFLCGMNMSQGSQIDAIFNKKRKCEFKKLKKFFKPIKIIYFFLSIVMN